MRPCQEDRIRAQECEQVSTLRCKRATPLGALERPSEALSAQLP